MPKNPYPTRVDPINLPRRLREGLQQADDLLKRKSPQEALELLHELDKKFPRSPDVLGLMANTLLDLQNLHGHLHVMYRLHKLTPNRADIKLGLADAYLANERMALALQTFHQFLKKWPRHERAAEAQDTVSKLETGLAENMDEFGMTLENGLEFAGWHEEVQVLMEAGELKRGKQLARKLIKQRPDFVPPLNNLSQIHWLDGDLPAAIETAHQVLAIQPDNVHALSNLTRYMLMLGNQEQARAFAKQLAASEADAADPWVKKAEAFGFIGDHDALLELVDQAKQAGELDAWDANAYHNCAVAAYQRGDTKQARAHWRKALELTPYFILASDNLEELKKKKHERLCPQAFSLETWLPKKMLDKLDSAAKRAAHQGGDQTFQKQIKLYLDQHPQALHFVPAALQTGDNFSRGFALQLADMSAHPELLSNLQEFALSKTGPDNLRIEATQILSKHGVFKSGQSIDFWSEGKWKSITMLGFQINYGPSDKSPLEPAVQRLMEKAISALREQDGAQAEGYIRKALEIQPREPNLINNLALSLMIQGKKDEADVLANTLPVQFPDYFFGWVVAVRKAIDAQDIERGKGVY